MKKALLFIISSRYRHTKGSAAKTIKRNKHKQQQTQKKAMHGEGWNPGWKL